MTVLPILESPLIFRVKYWSVLPTTVKGPSYGGWNGFFTASVRTNTCVQVFRALDTNTEGFECLEVPIEWLVKPESIVDLHDR